MKHARLEDMIRGWFIGDFEPSLYRTRHVEVGVRHYRAGEYEAAHFHRVATEFTVVTEGKVQMGGRQHGVGEIILIEPGETTDFLALTDAVTVVVKIPGAVNDKYAVDEII